MSRYHSLLDGANFLDNEIYNLENQLPNSVESARIAKTIATRDGIDGMSQIIS